MARNVLSGLIQASNPINDESRSVAEIQSAMLEKHMPMIHDAGKKGVQILCLQEIFNGPYFCPGQDKRWYDAAEPVPGPTVEGHSVPGGYSGQCVRPIALRQVMEVARANPGVQISGIGGIETGFDAAQFFLLGASTVQVCTGAMLRGYEIISELKEELGKFMIDRGFENLRAVVGKSLPYFTTHHDLVDRQKAAREAKEAAREGKKTAKDVETWKGDIAKETSTLVTN